MGGMAGAGVVRTGDAAEESSFGNLMDATFELGVGVVEVGDDEVEGIEEACGLGGDRCGRGEEGGELWGFESGDTICVRIECGEARDVGVAEDLDVSVWEMVSERLEDWERENEIPDGTPARDEDSFETEVLRVHCGWGRLEGEEPQSEDEQTKSEAECAAHFDSFGGFGEPVEPVAEFPRRDGDPDAADNPYVGPGD